MCYSLHLFQSFESFRILISGGDGSVGWVLMAIDKLGLTNRVKPVCCICTLYVSCFYGGSLFLLSCLCILVCSSISLHACL